MILQSGKIYRNRNTIKSCESYHILGMDEYKVLLGDATTFPELNAKSRDFQMVKPREYKDNPHFCLSMDYTGHAYALQTV